MSTAWIACAACIRETELDEVVMAIHPAQFSQIPRGMAVIGKLSIPARAIVDLGEGIVVRERLFQIGRMQMLDLTATPSDLPDYVLLKRAFDISFGRGARGSCSAHGFDRVGDPANLARPDLLQARADRAKWPAVSDVQVSYYENVPLFHSDARHTPRRTRGGRASASFSGRQAWMSCPEFVNVLKGNMSVVGPRPELTHFATKFLQEIYHYNHRHCLRVGMTGWAQVNRWRGDTSIDKRVEYDLYYLQNWTFGFDLRIILSTVFSVLVGKNAY